MLWSEYNIFVLSTLFSRCASPHEDGFVVNAVRLRNRGYAKRLIGCFFFSLAVGQGQDIRDHRRDTVRGPSLQRRLRPLVRTGGRRTAVAVAETIAGHPVVVVVQAQRHTVARETRRQLMIATWPTRVGHSVSSNPSTVGVDPAATDRVPFIFASSKFKKYKKHIAVRHSHDNVDHISSNRSSASIQIKQNVRETKANSIKQQQQQQSPLAYYTSYKLVEC